MDREIATEARGMRPLADDPCLTVLERLATRRSIRRYLPRTVDNASIDRILRAIAWAPSAHNRQPTRVIRIDTQEWKVKLARAMGERLRTDRLRDGDAAEVVEQDVHRSFERISTAPLVLILCMDRSPMDHYRDARRQEAEYLMAVQSVAIAAQNALVAAHAIGLGACWMCAPLFCPDTVIEVLGAPATWEPQLLLTVGYPANAGRPPLRQPLEEIVWCPHASD